MDIADWIDLIDARIARRSRAADRAWAWAHIAHLIALNDLLTDRSTAPSAACWVEPRIAWTLDDLASAGTRTDPVRLPLVDPADTPEALQRVLDRLILTAAAPDAHATAAQADACAQAVTRAVAARLDYATSPT